MGKKKIKVQPTDGLGPKEIANIRNAVRLVWQRSYSRKLVVKRCIGADGFSYCETCFKRTPQLKIDHIDKVGDVDEGFITRLFVPSTELQGICKECHDEKTKQERSDEEGKTTVRRKRALPHT